MSKHWTDERIDRYADIYRQAAVEYVMVPAALPNVHETFDAWLAAVEGRAYGRAIHDARTALIGEDDIEWARKATRSVISLPYAMQILDDLETTND